MTTDPILAEVMAANVLVRSGDRASGRQRFEILWARLAQDGEPIHQCLVAHHMADAQDSPADELEWDLRALDAGLRSTDADAQRHNVPVSIASFMPSLHASLAEDYLKLGDLALSRDHLSTARTFAGTLADDPYGRMILGFIDRIAAKLAAASNEKGPD